MRKFLLGMAALFAVSALPVAAQDLHPVDFNFTGFRHNFVSFDKPDRQGYFDCSIRRTETDNGNGGVAYRYNFQKQTQVFTTYNYDYSMMAGLQVSSAWVYNNVMYGVRYVNSASYAQLVTFDETGIKETKDIVPFSAAPILAAMDTDTNELYIVTQSANAGGVYSLAKCNPADITNATTIGTISQGFTNMPISIAYCPKDKMIYMVDNSLGVYKIDTKSGSKTKVMSIYVDGYTADPQNNGSYAHNYGAAMIWSEEFNGFIWCSRYEYSQRLCFLEYEPTEGDKPVSHNIISQPGNDIDYQVFLPKSNAIDTSGMPKAPATVSVQVADLDAEYPNEYKVTWTKVTEDVEGNPLTIPVSYDVKFYNDDYVTTGVTEQPFMLTIPSTYQQDNFYVYVRAVTEKGASVYTESRSIPYNYDPNVTPEPGDAVEEVSAAAAVVAGAGVLTVNAPAEVYSVAGARVATLAEAGSVNLNAGVYVVRVANKAVKVVVK